MTDKLLIKVVSTVMTGIGGGRIKSQMGRGIAPLKRGVKLIEFMQEFLHERGISTELMQREDNMWVTAPIMSLNTEPKVVITYHFITFPASELGYYAKDLTKAELERDMKHLKRYTNG